MHDHFSEYYEWDENGIPRRKKRVARDREHIHFPVTVMDAMQALGFHSTFSDGSRDFTSPHRPGYRFLDVNDEAKIAANDAYEARRERIHYSSRQRQQDANADDRAPARTLDALRQAAEKAYEDRNARMRNAWKQRAANEEA
jgi:hypothetical protein